MNTTVEGVKYSDAGYPVIRAKNIEQNQIDFNDIVYVDKATFEKVRIDCKPNYGDILYTNIGSRFGNASVVQKKEPFIIAWNVLRIQSIDCVNSSFLSYLLNSNRLRITNLNSSSTMSFINGEELGKLEFCIPPLKTQESIVEILGSLDLKIKLNLQMNKTLEAVGEAVFKRWFVDFEFPNQEGKPYKSSGGEMAYNEDNERIIPFGWVNKKVNQIEVAVTDFVANGSFASLKENVKITEDEDFALFIRNTDLKNDFSSKRYVDEHSYKFPSKSQLHGGEIIISNVGDVGSVFLCPWFKKPMALGNNVIMIDSNGKDNFNYYLYYHFKLNNDRIK